MPDILSAACFPSLRPQYKNTPADAELPAAIEHLFPQGTMIDHYYVTLSPELSGELQSLLSAQTGPDGGAVNGVVFCQQPDAAPWKVHFREPLMLKDICIDMPDAEFRALLDANHIVLTG